MDDLADEESSDQISDSQMRSRSGGSRSRDRSMEGNYKEGPEEDVVYIGPLTEQQRLEKVRAYLKKKYNKIFS